ncbi:hypothetical protein HPB47_025348 [Ixodes persulcatus]|uniref:Uncharacterized protein n=1 Tax=Ixodes persulcatus TaxID=34615 RepID=A0AC60Q1T3_IXOPE|nr:hypothetical protein HPB47_025348 [Ixodes persulcatus]
MCTSLPRRGGAESAPGPPGESGGRFKCRFCTYSSKHKWVLIQHVRTHTGERPFQCEYCLKTFTQRTNLKTHLRFHTGERPYSCEFCPKTFAQCSNFKAHVHRHTRAEPHKCAAGDSPGQIVTRFRSVETRKKVAEGSIPNSPSGARETSNGRWYNRWPEEVGLE